MKYAIGYQLPDENDSITEIAKDYREHLEEVYFAWPGEASGRSPLGLMEEVDQKTILEVFEEELAELDRMGIKLVLLFNANCYGDKAISLELRDRVLKLMAYVTKKYRLAAVTTTSPFIAKTIKEACPEIEIRASVNMRIGTVKGMEYQSKYFDGFYMQREFNRDLSRIGELKAWCDGNGKKLYLLANSGCLNFCSSQTFHDNMVAHEAGIIKQKNMPSKYPSPCWEYMEDSANWVAYLQNSWIRPEDIHRYEPWFPMAKLATRMHANPRKVLAAYVRGKHRGNLMDLTEPGFGKILQDHIIDNTLFPADWFERTTSCDKQCHLCGYCKSVLEKVLVKCE